MKYKCAGCTESGRKREKEDGKPYDSKTYAQSMKNGRKYMEMAPGGKYELHNAGCSTCISVLWDWSPPGVGDAFSKIIQKMKKGSYKMEYVDERATSQAAMNKGMTLEEFIKDKRAANAATPPQKHFRNFVNSMDRKKTATVPAAAVPAVTVPAATVPATAPTAKAATAPTANAATAPKDVKYLTVSTNAYKSAEVAADKTITALSQEMEKLRVAKNDHDRYPGNPIKKRAYDAAIADVEAAKRAMQEAENHRSAVFNAAAANSAAAP
jgi:hypothetical protein